jgi:hypothetical protein
LENLPAAVFHPAARADPTALAIPENSTMKFADRSLSVSPFG